MNSRAAVEGLFDDQSGCDLGAPTKSFIIPSIATIYEPTVTNGE